jgi:hypothetical protein
MIKSEYLSKLLLKVSRMVQNLVFNLKLVSKELNHFGTVAAFFEYGAPGTLTDGA